MSGEPLSEREFDVVADRSLRALDRAINEIPDGVEADLQSGILTLEFEDGIKYVINSHRAARQIWMAAISTAWHFDPQPDGHWTAAKTGDELRATIRRDTYWSTKVRHMLMSRNKMPYIASLSSMSSRSTAAIQAISDMHNPDE